MLAPAAPPCEIVSLHLPSEPVGAHGRLGLVGLATDLNSESDLRRMAPAGVEIFTNRVRNANPVTMDNHRAMARDVTRAAADILPGLHLDAMIYGCTSGTVAIGEGEITRLIQAARPGIPCTNPITAVLAALRTLGAQRIAVLTPYTRAVNDELAAFLVGRGIAITRLAGFDLDSDEAMTAVAPAAILEAGLAFCDQSADLLFVSCTALRTSVVVEALEQGLGKPVVASNTALLWHALRLIGNTDPIRGFGCLFDQP